MARGTGEGRPLFAATLGFIAVALFAGTLPATRIAVTALDPSFIVAGRALVAGLLAAILLTVRGAARPARADWPSIALLALCLVFGFPFFSSLAMLTVPANHGAVVLAILPLATAVAGAIVGGERPGATFWLVSAIGGVLVLIFSLSHSGWVLVWGDVFLLAAAATAALGYAVSGRLSRQMPGWAVVSWGLVLMLPLSAIASWFTMPATWPTSHAVWGAFAYLGVFSMLVGFFFWNAAMAIGGIARIGQIQLLQPFFTMIIATWVGGEALEPRLFGFAAAVVAIVATAQRLKVRQTQP